MPFEITRFHNGTLDIAVYNSRYHWLVDEIIINGRKVSLKMKF